MLPFLLRRLVQAVPTLLLSSLLIFFVISLAPGDFLTPAKLNPNISAQQLDNLTRNFGLDKPLVQQYLLWMRNILHGDFGLSFSFQAPVLQIMWPRIVNSLWLVLVITVVFYGLAIPIGVFGAVRQNSLGDRSVNVFMYFLLGFPSFFLALIALYFLLQIIFATHWAIPIGGMTSPDHASMSAGGKVWDVFKHLLVPGILLGIHQTAGLSRYVRALMLEVMNSDYIRTARAKGVSESSAIWKHTFRNAILPIVAGIGGELPGLISGAGFIEVVFAYPGITPMLLDALNAQDLYLIAGFTMMTTILLIAGNAISDILLAFVDPRVKLG
ncbi:peptide/nickel transport system permease protein [Deinococcus metalli]|uniref:Peptide ABC transporter permease n=1 Tax=Deinococcus metalli TaxID=1141878 RepID=A0A7W8KCH2_9DEIO|nr:ABC transporter permease [Deinococcus metalli]MBB5375193.1 peptide/nickel transport system permease protein [Deinococcus metalli]GHF31063.1 peptide ABC transporter permease [Deinococcus metalli]